jgi:hypothetical protein
VGWCSAGVAPSARRVRTCLCVCVVAALPC